MDTGNPILFEVKSNCSFEESYKFQKFVFRIRMVWSRVVVWVLFGLALLAAIIDVSKGKIGTALSELIVPISCILFIYIIPYISAKISNNSPILQNNMNHNCFYQDCFVNTDKQSQAVIYYNQLVSAYETDEYFYLFVEKHRAYVIDKNGFVVNTPIEMRKLLQIKLGTKYICCTKLA